MQSDWNYLKKTIQDVPNITSNLNQEVVIERELALATWNGRTVLIDDNMPATEVEKSGDVEAYDAASSTLIQSVQEAIDPDPQGEGLGIAPIDHIVTVNTATNVTVNVSTSLTFDEGYSFDAFITTKGGQAVSASTEVKKTIQVGSTVRLNKGAKTYSGGSLASFVYERNHQVKEISGDRAVITYGGTVVAAVKVSDLTLV